MEAIKNHIIKNLESLKSEKALANGVEKTIQAIKNGFNLFDKELLFKEEYLKDTPESNKAFLLWVFFLMYKVEAL